MWDCPTRGGKQVPPTVPGNDTPKKNRFYAPQTRGSKLDEDDDDDCKLLYSSL